MSCSTLTCSLRGLSYVRSDVRFFQNVNKTMKTYIVLHIVKFKKCLDLDNSCGTRNKLINSLVFGSCLYVLFFSHTTDSIK